METSTSEQLIELRRLGLHIAVQRSQKSQQLLEVIRKKLERPPSSSTFSGTLLSQHDGRPYVGVHATHEKEVVFISLTYRQQPDESPPQRLVEARGAGITVEWLEAEIVDAYRGDPDLARFAGTEFLVRSPTAPAVSVEPRSFTVGGNELAFAGAEFVGEFTESGPRRIRWSRAMKAGPTDYEVSIDYACSGDFEDGDFWSAEAARGATWIREFIHG